MLFVVSKLIHMGITEEKAKQFWDELETFAVKSLAQKRPGAAFAGIIFDGAGGVFEGAENLGDFFGNIVDPEDFKP